MDWRASALLYGLHQSSTFWLRTKHYLEAVSSSFNRRSEIKSRHFPDHNKCQYENQQFDLSLPDRNG
jgi:hypothetical protein